ncbi:hypothetical protein ACRB68_73590 [Actinomadura sp. RB68]|uniref:Transglutaminase-like domain-containing protein n=2 Tax=Actinomadura macrotermitis TaxID=2585200 RepID=A0A7K0C8W9_9ACTN|nr:hypothetical protein [Actinomadura macrotermitis]
MPVFGPGPLMPVVMIAAAVSPSIAVLVSCPLGGSPQPGRFRERPLWGALVIHCLGWLLATLVLFHDWWGQGPYGLTKTIPFALLDAWKRILTVPLPAPAHPELLCFVQTTTWLVALIGAELILRTKSVIGPSVPAVAAFGLGTLVAAGDVPLWLAASLVGLIVLSLPLADFPRRLTVSTWWGHGRAIAIAGCAVGVAVSVTPHIPVRSPPYDPRQDIDVPDAAPQARVSPLDRVSAWLQNPDDLLFTVRASRPENWRLAILDRYDGYDWTSSAAFVATSSSLPGGSRRRQSSRLDQEIVIRNLRGSYLPAADRPSVIQGHSVIADPMSGVLVLAMEASTSGFRYHVTSQVPRFTSAELGTAVVSQDRSAQAALPVSVNDGGTAVVAASPEALRRELQDVHAFALGAVGNIGNPFDKAALLADYLRSNMAFDRESPPGHTAVDVLDFLKRTHRGTPEQFATAYALMARSLGLPTRIAVGFRPGSRSGDAWEVRGRDVLVWPEVAFARVGWVPFYPTPEPTRAPHDAPPATAAAEQQLRRLQNSTRQHPAGSAPSAIRKGTPVRVTQRRHKGPDPLWLMSAIAVGVFSMYVLLSLSLPALRAHRRRRRSPAAAIAGAWMHLNEALPLLGVTDSPARTFEETRAAVRRRLDGAVLHLDVLVPLVNAAYYSTQPLGMPDADLAWRHSRTLSREIGHKVGWRRRLAHRLQPKTIFGPTFPHRRSPRGLR